MSAPRLKGVAAAARLALLVWFASCTLVASAKEPAPGNWLTGQAFSAQLEQPTNVACTDRPLATVLTNLSQAERVAIWLDRRVDPERPLTLAIRDSSFKSVIGDIATQADLGQSALGAVIYLGPADAAAKLRTLAFLRAEQVQALPVARRKALGEVRPWHWADLATPRELLADLAREARVDIRSQELVPHDLWAARSLPPLAWIDRLSLIAVQFGLTFDVAGDGKSVELVPVPAVVSASRTYPAETLGREKIEVLAQQYPDAALRRDGDRIIVEGRVEDLEAIVAGGLGRRTRTKTTTPGKQVYKLSSEQPVAALLEELGKRLDLDFQLDRAAIAEAGISLDQTVAVKVENASLDELIDAVLAPAGLKGRRKGRVVHISPAAARSLPIK